MHVTSYAILRLPVNNWMAEAIPYMISSLDVTNFDVVPSHASWSPGLAIIVHEKPALYSKVSVEDVGHWAVTCLLGDTSRNICEMWEVENQSFEMSTWSGGLWIIGIKRGRPCLLIRYTRNSPKLYRTIENKFQLLPGSRNPLLVVKSWSKMCRMSKTRPRYQERIPTVENKCKLLPGCWKCVLDVENRSKIGRVLETGPRLVSISEIV